MIWPFAYKNVNLFTELPGQPNSPSTENAAACTPWQCRAQRPHRAFWRQPQAPTHKRDRSVADTMACVY
ncbi:MAG: hypothetical protein ACLSAP_05805 [Oscillospiraceae bacterium]